MMLEKGNFPVMVACCTSGNCVDCLAGWNRKLRKRKLISDRVSEETARKIAANWRACDPTIESTQGGGQ